MHPCEPLKTHYTHTHTSGCDKGPASGTGVFDNWRVRWTGQHWGSAATQ